MSLGGGEPGLRPWSGLTSTAAISLARASITRSDAGLMSLSASTSLVNRSLPAPGCTPSHQPWYAPANVTMSLRRVLKRAMRTAHMTASVPDMWNETSSSPEMRFSRAITPATSGCSGPSTLGPSSFTRAQPRSTKPLYPS